MSEVTKLPALPALSGIADPATRAALMAIKEVLEVRDGRRGQKLDRFVTLRELGDAGVVAAGRVGADGRIEVLAGGGEQDFTSPPAISGLVVTGGYAQIFLEWDAPAYKSFSHVEVWRATTDAVGLAQFIGETAAATYSDACGTQRAYFYWVRAISKAGIAGPFNAVGGSFARTADDIAYIIDQLTGGDDPNQPFYAVSERFLLPDGVTWVEPGLYVKDARIANGTIKSAMIGTAAIDSAKIADAAIVNAKIANAAVTAAKIGTAQVGTAHIQNAAITNALIQDAAITNAKIADVTIGFAKIANDIQSSNYVAGSAGWKIDKTGQAELNNATFRGTLDVQSAAAGARLQITNSCIKVYDGNGVVRVKIGDLAA